METNNTATFLALAGYHRRKRTAKAFSVLDDTL
jgi:hypothetical protein